MNLVHPNLEMAIFVDNAFSILQIENNALFTILMRELWQQSNGEEGRWVLSKDGSLMSFDKYTHFILSPHLMDLTNRKLVLALQRLIVQQLQDKGVDLQATSLLATLYEMINEVVIEEPFASLKNEKFQLVEIIKLFDLGFDIDRGEHLIEQVEDYVLIQRDYLDKAVFLFCFLSAYLSWEEIEELAGFAAREEVQICLIESYLPEKHFSNNVRWMVVDNDLCDLITNA